jgi:molecular chaperone GrpE
MNQPEETSSEAREESSLDPFTEHSQNIDQAQSDFAGEEEIVNQLRGEVEEANRRVLMAQAEIENSRKRMRRDYEDQLKYASLPLLKDTLEVLDNLRRALDAARSAEAATGFAEGVAMVAKQLEEVIGKHHCTPIATDGVDFDPNVHEAISQMPSDTIPQGKIAHVAVVGYQLHDRVIRPSQVIISTGPITS